MDREPSVHMNMQRFLLHGYCQELKVGMRTGGVAHGL